MSAQNEIKPGLVVIGMQHAAFHAGDAAADFAVRRTCSLIDRARRDGVQIVFIQQTRGHGPLAYGGQGWRLIDLVQPCFPDWVVQASEADIFAHTNLCAQLRAIGINRLVVAGLDADSVEVSCQSAMELGFEAALAAGDQASEDAFMALAGRPAGADTLSFA